jgi:hypothetical protein
MNEAEIFWPASLPTDAMLDGAATLRDSGIETTCRIQPVRRGVGLSVLVLLTTTALEPFLKVFFEQAGREAWRGLQRFVRRLTGDDESDDAAARPEAVVFESSATGAQFVFTAGLPVSAFQQAIELDPGDGPGRWTWDAAQQKWMRFEEVPM